MSATPKDRIVAHVYDKDVKTRLGWLPRARACEWVDVNSYRGWGSFEVPLNDASTSLIDFGRIVRLTWLHQGVYNAHFDVRIKEEATQLAVDGMRWLRFEHQPGLLDLAGDAGIDPEGGLEPDSADTRFIGFMSPTSQPWYIPSSWITPRAEQWGAAGSEHGSAPADFRVFDKLAEWISVVGPSATQPPYVDNYFIASFTLAAATDVRALWTADNYPDFYIDAQPVPGGSWGPPGSHQWRSANTFDMHLDAGTHWVAVRVKNGRHVIPDRPNPIAFICSVREVLASGKLGAVLLRTNSVDWLAHDNSPQPGWHSAQVLHRLVVEAQNRGVDALLPVKFGFGLKHDSHGRRWSDRDQFQFDAVTGPSVAEIATQLSETEMDVWVRSHGGAKLMAAVRRGKDRSATVNLYLGDHVNGTGDQDGTLKAHEVTATMPGFTFGRVRTATGRWITVHDDAQVTEFGRIEAGLSLGSTNSDQTARQVARGILEQNNRVRVELQSDDSQLEGAVAYKHYGTGDTIGVPGQRNARTTGRILAIHVVQTEFGVAAQPEYRKDES